MTRKLRLTDEACTIKQWTTAIQAILTQLMKVLEYKPLTQKQIFWENSANNAEREGAQVINTCPKLDQRLWMNQKQSTENSKEFGG